MTPLARARKALALRIAAPFIAEFEGGQSRDGKFHAYRDPVGVVTIGYGETQDVRLGDVWSARKARRRLRKALAERYAPHIDKLRLPLKPRMYAAVLSAIYNLGPGVLAADRSLGRDLRAHHWHQAADTFLLYDKAGSPPRALPGLTRRRKAERKLFLSDLEPR